jgi:hypothetical protein
MKFIHVYPDLKQQIKTQQKLIPQKLLISHKYLKPLMKSLIYHQELDPTKILCQKL